MPTDCNPVLLLLLRLPRLVKIFPELLNGRVPDCKLVGVRPVVLELALVVAGTGVGLSRRVANIRAVGPG